MVTHKTVNSLKYYIKTFLTKKCCFLLCTKNKSWVFKKGIFKENQGMF